MIRKSSSQKEWTLEIKPSSSWFDLHLDDVWRYRDLIFLMVNRNFVTKYKQTILGPLWYILQPLITTLIFSIIFGKVANIPTDGLPKILFYMSGIITWNYFSSCLNGTSNTFVGNAGLFGKVYFPRLTIPISVVITNLLTFFIQLLLFTGFMVYFYSTGVHFSLNSNILLLPLFLLQMALLSLGMGIIISSMTTRYRDLAVAVGFGVQLWMYATPIVYPLSIIPEKSRWMFYLNPMTSIVESFRYSFLGVGSISLNHIALSILMTIVILFFGLLIFNRVEKNFMDTV